MDWHLIQGGVEILLVASCYGNWDKLRPDGPLGLYADFTLPLPFTWDMLEHGD